MVQQSIVGSVGTLLTGIRGGNLPGEVRVMIEGIAHYYLGYAVAALPAGATVLVINDRGARHIDVEPWPTLPGESARVVKEGL